MAFSVSELPRLLTSTFADTLYRPFLDAMQAYSLVQTGDRVAVCISGGKDSMLLAKLMQLYQQEHPDFELHMLVMDPGYSPANRRQIEQNLKLLEIPATIDQSDIFSIADETPRNPCYLCARMRRGFLYSRAQRLGCNKIALGHHLNDVIETTVMGMFYGAQLQAMMPKLRSKNFEGMELIRPLYRIREQDILAWRDAFGLCFLQCACRLTERAAMEDEIMTSKRKETKLLLAELMKTDPAIEQHVFSAIHTADPSALPGWKNRSGEHTLQR